MTVALGTGVGGGIVVDGKAIRGANAIAGEWGHNALPQPGNQDFPLPPCYCGRAGCIETYLSGPGLAADHERMTGRRLPTQEVVSDEKTMARYEDRLARALAGVINVLTDARNTFDGMPLHAVMGALMAVLRVKTGQGDGQVVDVSIIEPILAMLGPQITRWDQTRTVQPRTGNRSANNAPRNTYRTRDGQWVAVSTSAPKAARCSQRRMAAVAAAALVAFPALAQSGPTTGPFVNLPGTWAGEGATNARFQLENMLRTADRRERQSGYVQPLQDVKVRVTNREGDPVEFTAVCRIDTPVELEYYRNGGILHTVLRQLLKGAKA